MPTWVGDACLATPSLRALREAFPDTRIVGIMRPVIGELLDSAWGDRQPWFDEVVLFNKKPAFETLSRWGLVRELKNRKVELAVLLTNSLWSAVVARLAGIKHSVGYDRDARGWLLSDRIAVPRQGKMRQPISPVDYYLGLVHWLGAEISNRKMQLGVNENERQLADQLWFEAGFCDSIPTVAINSGAATVATRVWPLRKVQQLAVRIADELGWQVMLHCGPAERESINRLASDAHHPKIASMGISRQLPIGLSKAVLGRVACVVSTDSGPRHMAVAMDRRVISIFGPTVPVWTTTYNIPEQVIAESLSCRPCRKSSCPLKHHRCMEDISVERVFAAVAHAQ